MRCVRPGRVGMSTTFEAVCALAMKDSASANSAAMQRAARVSSWSGRRQVVAIIRNARQKARPDPSPYCNACVTFSTASASALVCGGREAAISKLTLRSSPSKTKGGA